MTNEELNSVMAKAKEQFRKGEPLFGKNVFSQSLCDTIVAFVTKLLDDILVLRLAMQPLAYERINNFFFANQ
ncbi:hypothetical protein Fisuc_2689 [Fibrobacter succinogenes subsp. succinogenes S85]|nr:hypothetical protein [Fibrobacter succinogenes]ACX76272.1 hypothetical protein Fisuc_2689 [Fibrobacter succinogenes subsp. succinogenes S85]